MKFLLSAASGLAICAFLVVGPTLAQDRLDANGMPTSHSTPAEQAQTQDLNNQVQAGNHAADAKSDVDNAQYQAQQQQYQSQMQQNQMQQQRYVNQTAEYENLRDHYAEARRAYHRAVWPERYRNRILERDARLIDSRVEIINGDRVGTVASVARTPAGRIEGLQVRLDGGKVVWIDQSDVRFDRSENIVMTNLDRSDLHQMADQRM
jgi:hypothetical protein